MKTTIELPDALFSQTKALAQREGTSLRAIMEQALQKWLAERQTAKPYVLQDFSVGGGGWVHPDIAAGDWSKLRESANDRDAA